MRSYAGAMTTPDLQAMREDYSRATLDEADAGHDPLALLERWVAEAVEAQVHEPNAMALATATPGGAPSVRIVLLKGLDERGAVFYTGYGSRKGRELQENPRAALVLLWHEIQRQVRIEGAVTRIDADESDAYFSSRPRGSQVGAAASPQSQVVADRSVLDARVAEVEQLAGDGAVERPDSWGGFRVALETVEFWQGRSSRLHDRLRFTRAGDGWDRERLAP